MDRVVVEVLDTVGEGCFPELEAWRWSGSCASSKDGIAAGQGEDFGEHSEGAWGDARAVDLDENTVGTRGFGFGTVCWDRALFAEGVGCGDCHVEECGCGCGGGSYGDYVTFDVHHANGDRADDVEGVAEATGDKVFVGDGVGSRVGA